MYTYWLTCGYSDFHRLNMCDCDVASLVVVWDCYSNFVLIFFNILFLSYNIGSSFLYELSEIKIDGM